jgi:hypothetical protein
MHDHSTYTERFDHNYRNPEVVAAFKQKGTNHPITVVKYKNSDDAIMFRIMWNNKRLNHDPFTSSAEAVEFIKENAQVVPWTVTFRPLAV